MTDEQLKKASRALRETLDGQRDQQVVSNTRELILQDFRKPKSRTSKKWMVMLSLAAAFVASTAWAANAGYLKKATLILAPWTSMEPEPPRTLLVPTKSPTHPVVSGILTANPPIPAPEPVPEPTATTSATAPSLPSATATVTATANPPSPSSAPVAATSSSKPAEKKPTAGEIQALYMAAHQAHFSQRNWTLALASWNRYLKAAPRGRFASEAYYNRGICFARLGNKQAAIQALRPFAQGSFGGYRQSEATQLIDALEK
jgi:TolA-binding protein